MDTRPAWLKASQPFIVGGLSGCFATAVIQPVDMVKVQLQILGKSAPAEARRPFTIAQQIIKKDGVLGLYKGLDAGLLRQITYTTSRMGLFRILSNAMKKPEEKTLKLWKKGVAGLTAGGIGSLIGTPSDLALVRLQSDITLPPELRRGYTGALNALSRILKEEGFFSLWKGAGPTVTRAMSLNMGMLASFDQAKEMLESRIGPGWNATLTASAISGYFAVVMSLPFDYMKTKMQRMKIDPVTGMYPYKSMIDCGIKTMKSGGPLEFYTGFLTYYVRVAPHAMITLVILDYINKVVFQHYTKKSN